MSHLSPNDTLNDLILELDRTHTAAYDQSEEFRSNRDFPNFATAANGEVRNFYKSARSLLRILTATLYEQHTFFKKHIDEKRFAELVRQVVVDLHASEVLARTSRPYHNLVAELTERVNKGCQTFTHSFPAWTCGVEATGAWTFGPVTFMTWSQWLTCVDFSDQVKATYCGDSKANNRWKELLLGTIKDSNSTEPDGLARLFVSAVTTCPAVLRVEVSGLDRNLSRKLGEIVCKSALDAVSLMIGQRQSFIQQALQVERLPPTGIDSIIESSGYLWLPGVHLTHRVPSLDHTHVRQHLNDSSSTLQALEHAINGLLDPSHPHPQLASRWATALDWYAEGQRERSDAIALAKFGTSLDVLANGGRFKGIVNLLTHLLGIPKDYIISLGTKQSTLEKVIRTIYERGRSQILHGNRHDRMEAFDNDRNIAEYVAHLALITTALRLKSYTGADEAQAFITMPPPISSTLQEHRPTT